MKCPSLVHCHTGLKTTLEENCTSQGTATSPSLVCARPIWLAFRWGVEAGGVEASTAGAVMTQVWS